MKLNILSNIQENILFVRNIIHPSRCRIRQSMVFFEDIHNDIHDFSEEIGMIKEIILSMSHLIEIFDMEENFDLDGKMISSLLSSGKQL